VTLHSTNPVAALIQRAADPTQDVKVVATMSDLKQATRSRIGGPILLAVLAPMILLQAALLSSPSAAEIPSEITFQQLMVERNARIETLKQSNGSAFQKLLEGQKADRKTLRIRDMSAAARQDLERQINQRYNEFMTRLGERRKEIEARIYSVWKGFGADLQAGDKLDSQRWQSLDGILSEFEDQFFASISEPAGVESSQLELADNIEGCTPFEQEFTHPFTGDVLVRSLAGIVDGACSYVEQLPGDGRMECLYPEDKLSQIADFYRNPARFEGAEIRSRTEFVDGEAVTTTEYIIDGKAVYHPLNDSIEKGECQILGYN